MLDSTEAPLPPAERRRRRVVELLLSASAFCAFFSISAMQACLGLALLAWLGGLARGGARGRAWPLAAPLAALTALTLVSSLASADPRASLADAREVLLPLAFLVAVQELRERRSRSRVVDSVVLATALAALLGIGQALVHGAEYRVHGTLGHYMSYSGVLAIGSLVALASALWAESVRARALATCACTLALVALLATHTRSAWLGWLVGAAAAAFLWRPRSLALVPVLALLAFAVAPGAVRERMQSLADLRDITAVERTYMWRAGLALWRDHPLLGVGVGNLRAAYPDYKLEDDPWLEEREFTHLHDNPLQIAGERGALALLAWLWIWLAWARLAARRWRRTSTDQRLARATIAAATAALLAFQVAGLFEYNFGDSEVVSLLWIVLALPLAGVSLRSKELDAPLGPERTHDERVDGERTVPGSASADSARDVSSSGTTSGSAEAVPGSVRSPP